MSSFSVEDYHVGIICALASEMAAVEAMLDEEHEPIPKRDSHDHNSYSLGCIHEHRVAIACLPAGVDGIAAAATVAKDMSRTFNQLRVALLVGIGGGIPDLERGIDIRLGDVVVSQPAGTSGGVVQYDKGRNKSGGDWERKGSLNAPPNVLLTALQKLRARHLRVDSLVPRYLSEMFRRFEKMKSTGYPFPGVDNDTLYSAMNERETVTRSIRATTHPEIHYGVIASGNQVIKNAAVRDQLRRECGALCVEMEAAGLMNEFPCLVIRGICDYADSYKNKEWQLYAAATAAAFAKELLLYISAEEASHEKPVQKILGT
jgi:nucleoside phosphorylase